MKIISSLLILVTAFLSLKHGWDGLMMDPHAEQAKMVAEMGLTKEVIAVMSILSMAVGLAVLVPQSFFIANLVNAISIVLIMAFSLRAGNYKIAFIEIPFLLIPLLLIYLGHPLNKR